MSSIKKVIDVYANDQNYDDVQEFKVLDGGVLRFVERDGDINYIGPAVEWFVMVRNNAD